MDDNNLPKYGNTSIGTDPSLLTKMEMLDIEPPTETIVEKEEDSSSNKKPRKNKKNTILMVIIVVFLMFAVGGGLFFYLRVGVNGGLHKVGKGELEEISEDKDIKANDIVYITGYDISKKVEDYITFKKNTNKVCKLDISSVNVQKPGDYKYYVTCDNIKYTASVKVVDKKTLTYTTYLAYKNVEDETHESSFASAENTTFTFNDTVSQETGVLNPVSLNAVNEDQTSFTVYGLLYIFPFKPSFYYNCSKLSGNTEIVDRLVFDENSEFMNYSIRVYKYGYGDNEINYYREVNNIKNGEITIDDKSGYAITNNAKKEISIVESLPKEVLDEEYDGQLPTSLSEVLSYYSDKGYICSN